MSNWKIRLMTVLGVLSGGVVWVLLTGWLGKILFNHFGLGVIILGVFGSVPTIILFIMIYGAVEWIIKGDCK